MTCRWVWSRFRKSHKICTLLQPPEVERPPKERVWCELHRRSPTRDFANFKPAFRFFLPGHFDFFTRGGAISDRGWAPHFRTRLQPRLVLILSSLLVGFFGGKCPHQIVFFKWQENSIYRWWFQIFFYFHPYWGKISNLTNIFQMAWNHQLVITRWFNSWDSIRDLFWDGEWKRDPKSKANRHLQRLGIKRSRLESTGRCLRLDPGKVLSPGNTLF